METEQKDLSLIWLSVALCLWGIGEGMFFMFQPLYLAQFGANPELIGYILSAFGFFMMVAHIPAGYLADRLGRRPMLITAWLLGILATWIMALATSLPSFVLGMLIYGLTAFVASPLNSYVTAARGNWSIGRALTLIGATFSLGSVIGPFTGGWVGDHFGRSRVYFIAAILFMISTYFVLMIKSQPGEKHDPAAPPPSLLGNRRFWGFLALGFFVTFSMYLPQPFTPNFLQGVRGFSLQQIGFLGTINGVGITVQTFLLGFLDVRLGYILGQLGAGVSTGLLWQTQAYSWFAVSYFMLGGYRAARSLYTAQIRPLVLESQMGLAYGITETTQSLTVIIAPILAGFLYQSDPISIYPIALAGIILSILLTFFFAPHTHKKPFQPAVEYSEIP